MIELSCEEVVCKSPKAFLDALSERARYFHISAHGDGQSLEVGKQAMDPEEMRGLNLFGSFVTLSSCSDVSEQFVIQLHKHTRVSAVVSPLAEVGFAESVLFSNLFYYSLAQAPKLSNVSRSGDEADTRLAARLAQYVDAFRRSKHAYHHVGGTGAHQLFYWFGGKKRTVS